jgi:ABC-2 type transport system ATP-binding protein
VTVLTLDSLTKSYGTRQALGGVSFTVNPGEIFGFVGSNGAGKTTTMRIILGVLASDSGTVSLDGHPITLDDRRHIGYMPEERGLYPKMHVGEQLEYLARLHGLTAPAARASAAQWAETLGVQARLDDEVQSLSLGNQQRVQLAAALVHNPSILVLDEPFSGLDPVAVDVMSGVLSERSAAGVPVIFSSHQLELVERLCHRVGIIKDGLMVAIGTINELRASEAPRFVVDCAVSEGAVSEGAVSDTAAPDTTGAPSWLAAVPNATLIGQDGSRCVVELPKEDDAEADGQALLNAALAAGPVREFAPARASLTDLYRHVVSSQEVSS